MKRIAFVIWLYIHTYIHILYFNTVGLKAKSLWGRVQIKITNGYSGFQFLNPDTPKFLEFGLVQYDISEGYLFIENIILSIIN